MKKRGSAGFTLVETIFAVAVFGVIVLLVFEMFIRGNRTASKATWRVHTLQAQRSGLRRLKELVQGSSYPTVIRIGDFIELRDGHRFELGNTAEIEDDDDAGVTRYRFADEGWILRFYRCHPCEDVEFVGADAESRAGSATGVALELVPRPGAPGLFDLWLETAEAPVEWSGGLVIGDYGPAQRLRLMHDVESFTVVLSQRRTDDGLWVPCGAVMDFVAACLDPWDRRMRLIESIKVEVNVEVDPLLRDLDANF